MTGIVGTGIVVSFIIRNNNSQEKFTFNP